MGYCRCLLASSTLMPSPPALPTGLHRHAPALKQEVNTDSSCCLLALGTCLPPSPRPPHWPPQACACTGIWTVSDGMNRRCCYVLGSICLPPATRPPHRTSSACALHWSDSSNADLACFRPPHHPHWPSVACSHAGKSAHEMLRNQHLLAPSPRLPHWLSRPCACPGVPANQSATIPATEPDCAGLLLLPNLPVLSVMVHLKKAASLLLPANPAQVKIPDLSSIQVPYARARLLSSAGAAATRSAGAR